MRLIVSIFAGTKTEAELTEPEQEDYLRGIKYIRELAKWKQRGS